MTDHYDLIVLGGGSGGMAASKRAASYGAKVALIEQDRIGGTCVLRGCVPKKLLMYASRASDSFKAAESFGWNVGSPIPSWPKLIDRVQKEVTRISVLQEEFLKRAGVTVLYGHGRIVSPHDCEVHGETTSQISADKILIAVGGRPVLPEISGREHILTSDDMFLLPELPRSAIIAGGGYISLEFASILRGFGVEVHVVVRRDHILHGFDEDIRSPLQQALTNRGIIFHTNNVIEHITQEGSQKQVTLSDGTTLSTDNVLLFAIGRVPLLDNLGLKEVGVFTKANVVKIDSFFQTNVPSIYAIGDCTDRFNLTPVAVEEGRVFADREFGKKDRTMNHDTIPTAVFTTPELSSVGYTEEAARRTFGESAIQLFKTQFRPMSRAFLESDEKIVMKIIVERASNRVIGVHMLGPDAAEIIQAVAIAVANGVTKDGFDETMALHPTSAEELVTLYTGVS